MCYARRYLPPGACVNAAHISCNGTCWSIYTIAVTWVRGRRAHLQARKTHQVRMPHVAQLGRPGKTTRIPADGHSQTSSVFDSNTHMYGSVGSWCCNPMAKRGKRRHTHELTDTSGTNREAHRPKVQHSQSNAKPPLHNSHGTSLREHGRYASIPTASLPSRRKRGDT